MNTKIGVIRKQTVPAPEHLRGIAASGCFVDALQARYSAAQFSVSRAELALAFEPAPVMNFFSTVRIDVSPRVVVNQPQEPASLREPAVAARAKPTAAFTEKEAAALFERLYSRWNRVSGFTVHRAAAAKPAAGAQRNAFSAGIPGEGVQPIDRILPRAAAAETMPAPPRAANVVPESSASPGWGTRISLPAGLKAFTLPEPEVRRVADRVMREIDHRIVAQRERMGRR